jgi:hypothetical protein
MMGIREKLNDKPALTGGVVGAMILVAVTIVAWRVMGGESYSAPSQAFYTDDGGKTYFRDSINRATPFERNGKQAYRAEVYRVDGGEPFVALVYRHNEAGRKAMDEYINARTKDPSGGLRQNIERWGLEVKPVNAGDRAWVLASDARGERLIEMVRGPDGKPATPVHP